MLPNLLPLQGYNWGPLNFQENMTFPEDSNMESTGKNLLK